MSKEIKSNCKFLFRTIKLIGGTAAECLRGRVALYDRSIVVDGEFS